MNKLAHFAAATIAFAAPTSQLAQAQMESDSAIYIRTLKETQDLNSVKTFLTVQTPGILFDADYCPAPKGDLDQTRQSDPSFVKKIEDFCKTSTEIMNRTEKESRALDTEFDASKDAVIKTHEQSSAADKDATYSADLTKVLEDHDKAQTALINQYQLDVEQAYSRTFPNGVKIRLTISPN